jgi:hypothetical protein
MNRINSVSTTLDGDSQNIRAEFDGFLGTLIGVATERRDKEEQSLMQ